MQTTKESSRKGLRQASPSLHNNMESSALLSRRAKKKHAFAFVGVVLLFLLIVSTLPVILSLFLEDSNGNPRHQNSPPVDQAPENPENNNPDKRAGYTNIISKNDFGIDTKINSIINKMPQWMQDYFRWHAKARHTVNQDHDAWKSFRYLLLQCLPGSRKCGGTADRLKPLPLMLWMAHKNQRIILIKWGRPAELEEYLMPPEGGMDWRVPDWLFELPDFRQGPRATNVEELEEMMANPEFALVKARVQSHDHGSEFYNAHRKQDEDEPTFAQVYHLCWHAMFTPAPPVAKLIEQQIDQAGLVPGHYVGIHIRALYAVSEREPALVQHWTRNAIHCASQLQPGGPFYISSDSSYAISVGKEYGQDRQVQVISRTEGIGHEQPYHLDKAPKSAKVSDFYDTFIDLYLLAMSRCITYSMGGFGSWALYISPYANSYDGESCSFRHHEAIGIHKCEWFAPGTDWDLNRPKQAPKARRNNPLFLPPMT